MSLCSLLAGKQQAVSQQQRVMPSHPAVRLRTMPLCGASGYPPAGMASAQQQCCVTVLDKLECVPVVVSLGKPGR